MKQEVQSPRVGALWRVLGVAAAALVMLTLAPAIVAGSFEICKYLDSSSERAEHVIDCDDAIAKLRSITANWGIYDTLTTAEFCALAVATYQEPK